MERLLQMHIQVTEKRFDEFKEQMDKLIVKIDELNDFKTSLIVSSRFFSLVISAVCGMITFIASTIITYYVNIKLTKG